MRPNRRPWLCWLTQLVTMGAAEAYCYSGEGSVETSGDPLYPGGYFE